jgi:DNA mismatch endonuclease (patch repair protein)
VGDLLFGAPRPPSPGPWASSPAARRTMQGNRRRDTKPELAVRRLLHAAGYRYRVDYQPLPELRRRADIVFTRQRVAVFIDGCYWHGCPEHGTLATTNAPYWSAKISANKRRDEDTGATLATAGWLVLRFWEHEEAGHAVAAIRAALDSMPRAVAGRAPG